MEKIVEFFDKLIRATKVELLATSDLNKKIIYSRELAKLKETRINLLVNHFVYEDYLKTGKIRLAKIKVDKCQLCGKIDN